MDNLSLVLDLVDWVSVKPRPYADVMDAWRTSCPRLSVWEDAVDAGYVERFHAEDGTAMVRTTPDGLKLLADHRPPRVAGVG